MNVGQTFGGFSMMGNRRRCSTSAWRHIGLRKSAEDRAVHFIDSNGAFAVLTGTASEVAIEFHWLVFQTQVRIIVDS